MNIIELRKLIFELQKDPIGNEKLIKFYQQKDKELINKLNKEINEKLKTLSPFISHRYNVR
tara:strand:- start:28670 stop:28852 length:183 start_codon:yes stop_codon:yes gene_type:complete